MSFEDTLSVGRDEAVELSSSESSSGETSSGASERVGGEIEEVGVPSNILEVDNGRAKYYNEEEEVVSEVVGYETSWKSRGELAHLVEQYSIPGHILFRLVGEME
ncbi:hypothetical protein SLEP1_g27648 [Rubroshorea leprosula]|uniref:Uncharacterized protein n=1 Tax=Rubroshorea leprosula TaxID=152421 RepID=A0AAV5JR80_9ROSI|nr:hypothetical protein SLEP1_g27648 [Rubroshorea leprosula]